MIHNEDIEDSQVTNKEKMIPEPVVEVMEEEAKQNGNAEDDDSDLLVCGEDANSPELEIIDVKKRVQPEGGNEEIGLKKKQKLEWCECDYCLIHSKTNLK